MIGHSKRLSPQQRRFKIDDGVLDRCEFCNFALEFGNVRETLYLQACEVAIRIEQKSAFHCPGDSAAPPLARALSANSSVMDVSRLLKVTASSHSSLSAPFPGVPLGALISDSTMRPSMT